ncbi:hypothetical protein K3495_g10524 [Podosphaera aphanis]|nr:hypothetical protein K3495_g10524 [Podosphaera aphanis]
MTIVSEKSGKIDKASILKTIPLKNGVLSHCHTPTLSQSFLPLIPFHTETALLPDASERLSEQFGHGKESLVKQSSKKGTATGTTKKDSLQPKVISNVEVKELNNFFDDRFRNQQRDIDRVSEKVNRIEEELQTMKNFLEEIRTELTANRQASDNDKRFAEVRSEISKVDQKLNQVETLEWNKAARLLARNLKTVAEDLQGLSTQVADTNDLRLAHETLASRLQHLEENRETSNFNKCSNDFKKKLEILIPKKRSKNSDDGNMSISEAKSSLFLAKKRCLNGLPDPKDLTESLDANNQKLRPEVIDLISPKSKSRSYNLDYDENEKFDLQGYQSKVKNLVSSGEPQVLDQPSTSETILQEEILDSLLKKISGKVLESFNKTPVEKTEKRRRKSSGQLPNHIAEDDQLILNDESEYRESRPNNEKNISRLPGGTEATNEEDSILSETEYDMPNEVYTSNEVDENILQTRWQCSNCREVFRSQIFLQKHQKNSVDCEQNKSPETKPLACEKCGKRYKNAGSLKNHYDRRICDPLTSILGPSTTNSIPRLPEVDAWSNVRCSACEKVWKSQEHYDMHKCFPRHHNRGPEVEKPE